MTFEYKTLKTTRLYIPHLYESEIKIAGDLEQVELDVPTQGRKLALILHGTMGHKDYLFQKPLAKSLPIDSFRFDFRGNHGTGGVWRMSALHEDIEDIQSVAQYLLKEFGYVVDLVVGHSRGSVVAMRWITTSPEASHVRGFVNISGRNRMERRGYIANRDPIYKPSFDAQGYYEWKVTVARKPVVGIIRPEHVEEFASWDNSYLQKDFPKSVHVLTIHGLKDGTVPPYDAIIYAKVFGVRSPGTHNLHIIEEADHNFVGHGNEVVNTILKWEARLEHSQLQTGIWIDDTPDVGSPRL